MQRVNAPHAPQAIGTYSHATVVENTAYISGQIGLVPETMQLISDDISKQTQQTFMNLGAVCRAAGGALDDIAKLTVYLTDIGNSSIVNEVMQKHFVEPYPARVMIEVSKLPKDALVEIDALMIIPVK